MIFLSRAVVQTIYEPGSLAPEVYSNIVNTYSMSRTALGVAGTIRMNKL